MEKDEPLEKEEVPLLLLEAARGSSFSGGSSLSSLEIAPLEKDEPLEKVGSITARCGLEDEE